MNNISKTLYIPLYSKSFVSKQGIILNDKKAEEIWDNEKIKLGRKSKSKWLCYFMSMRTATFDSWLADKMIKYQDAVVLHLGCGLDNRVGRVGLRGHLWFDIDLPSVIEVRKKYYQETDGYFMLGADLNNSDWLRLIPQSKNVRIVLEGVCMYMKSENICKIFSDICNHFDNVCLLADYYTTLGARMTKVKNPINEVGVYDVFGLDNPFELETDNGLKFLYECSMTPLRYIKELKGVEQKVFKFLYAGKIARKFYCLYEYRKTKQEGE